MRDQVLTWLADNVPASRLQHILGVEQMSVELARHYHLDVEKAAQAGLMHDLAKYFKPSVLLQMARDEGIEIDPICEATPHLLHADVSAIVAKEQFGMQDQEVMDAIAHHTLGRPAMSPLSCVVFLADSLEPNRGQTPELEKLRQVSKQDLYKAICLTSEYSLKFLFDSRCLIHPRTILTRNWALGLSRHQTESKSQLTAKGLGKLQITSEEQPSGLMRENQKTISKKKA
jgi:predicted HD superfamily hydrolase involved in NAD metabolism